MTVDTIHEIRPERSILGAVLSGWRGDLADLALTEADFADPNMGAVWDAITRHGRDPLTVQQALLDGPLKNRPALIAELVSEACGFGSVEYYAGQIAADADRRGLIACGQRIQQLGTIDRDPEDLIEEARTLLDQAPRRVNGTVTTMTEVLADAIDGIEHPEKGTPWPWDVNDLLMPLSAGRLYIVAGRPGMGKSLIGQGLAVDFARRHLPVAFASLEMSRRELGQRMLAQVGTVNIGRMARGEIGETDWERVRTATTHLGQLPIHVDDTPTQTVAHIRRHARDVKRRHSLGLIVVDYLQLVTARDSRAPRHEQVAEMSRSLKLLARDLEVPVVALAQLNRASVSRSDKRPAMSDLRESGAIEADADAVILLHQDLDIPGELLLIADKQRNGPKGDRSLLIAGHYSRIE